LNTEVASLPIKLGDIILEIVDKVEHLGHILVSNLSDEDDIRSQVAKFNSKCNAVLSDFNGIAGLTRWKMIITYCYSFYGCQLWKLNVNATRQFAVQWRKSCRRAFNLTPRTHSNLLPEICQALPFTEILTKRVLKLLMSCFKSNNKSLAFVTLNSCNMCNTSTASNAKVLRTRYNITTDALRNDTFSNLFKYVKANFYSNVSSYCVQNGLLIRECIQMRDAIMPTALSRTECQAIIDYASTS
jgi:hypothetical protein